MQLGATPGPLPTSATVADALRTAATRLGHRPAITVLRPERRDEQGYASLLKWTSKGAHLLEVEASAEVGDELRLDAPADWITAAVALAAWWSGLTITDRGGGLVTVTDERRAGSGRASTGAPSGGEGGAPADPPTYVTGGGPDGAPTSPTEAEPWSSAVQVFPDQPPIPRAEPGALALRLGDRRWTQSQLLEETGRWGAAGVLGVEADTSRELALLALLRPLRVGRPTVVLDRVDRQAAAADEVDVWA